MNRLVLLVEPDVDELGALASKLRAHGLEVAIADGLESASDRAQVARVSVLLVSSVIAHAPGFGEEIAARPALASLPRYVLVDGLGQRDDGSLARWDAEAIVKRVYALGRSVPVAASEDFRGDLKQVSVPDLLQLLGANRRSGSLSLSTPGGQGEVRLADGEVVDAVYRRVDGEKALIRLLGESEGTFSFVGGSAATLRRIERPTSALMMDGMRQLDETRRLLDMFALGDDALLASVLARPEHGDVPQRVLEALITPHTLEELLDEVPALDLDVLLALDGLMAAGAVRRLAGGTLRVELADAERLSVLSALARRIARTGFEGAPRLGLAGSQRGLATALSALSRISDTVVATDVPAAPVPHQLATFRLSEGVNLELVGVPLIDAFSPLWGLVLPSCAAIARIGNEPSDVLESACQLLSVPFVDAEPVVAEGEEADPERMAALVRTMLERAAGGD